MSEEWYRDRVVWGFYEEKTPEFYQGKDGEHEICEPVSAKEVSFYVSRIEELDRACSEWADASQANYQRARAAEAKLAKAETRLQHIAANKISDELSVVEWDTHDTFSILDGCILSARATLAELKGQGDE